MDLSFLEDPVELEKILAENLDPEDRKYGNDQGVSDKTLALIVLSKPIPEDREPLTPFVKLAKNLLRSKGVNPDQGFLERINQISEHQRANFLTELDKLPPGVESKETDTNMALVLDRLTELSDDEQVYDQLGLAMENQTIMSHADEEQIKMFFTKLKSKKSFRLAFMNLPDDLQRKVLMLPNGQLSLGGYTLNNMDNKEFVDPNSIELPERQIKFDVKDYMKFYEKVSKLSNYDETVSWIVTYLNQYFCIVNGDSYEVIEFMYGDYVALQMSDDNADFYTQRMEEEKQKVSYALSYTVRKPVEVKLRFRKCTFFNEQGKNTDLYDVWSRSPEAREYSDRVFDPMRSVSHEDTNVLNTFAGLKAEQQVVFDQNNTSMSVIEEDFALILLHIRNLCGGNNLYYEYLLDWLAYPIQTGEKTNVAVISHGGQGCGKSKFFVEFMGEQIYGSTLHAKIAGGKQVGGDFNAHISGKMYLAIEEPNDFSKAKLNLLKDLITASTIEVNGKGTNQVFVDDYTNYVFTCNSIPPDMLEDDDRRYFIIQHNGDKVGDTRFFHELSFCMETHGQEFYKFLKMRDIKHYVKGKKPPQTEIKKRLMTLAIDPIFKYLQHLAETEAIENYFKRPSDQSPILPWKAFFSNAVAWCDEECETIDWKKKPGDLKELLKTKLGDVEVCFEPTQVKIPDFGTGGFKNERCVLFPKTSDALMDLLTKKKVYSNSERVFETDNDYLSTSEGDLDDYEILLEEEAAKAELVELEAMRKRYEELKNMDKFDSQ